MRARVAALVASLAGGLVSWPVAILAVSPQLRPTPIVPDLTSPTPRIAPAATWNTFSADLTLRRGVVKKDGTPALAAPDITYRWVRTLDEGGWKSSLTVVSVAPMTIQTSKGPEAASMKVPVSRIEIGDPRTPTRVFDTKGRMVFMMPTRARDAEPTTNPTGTGAPAQAMDSLSRVLGHSIPTFPADILDRAAVAMRSRDWVEHLMPSLAGRTSRRAALTREMGSSTGMVRGLERFVTHASGAMTEVLSDPTWAVPVEINIVRDGGLVSHSTLTYVEDPGAGLVRRRLRSEQVLSPESGDRAVVDFELANIRLDRGGAR